MELLIPWLVDLALAIVLLGLVILVLRHRKLAEKANSIDSLQLQINQLQQALVKRDESSLDNEVNELRAGAVAMGRRLATLEQSLLLLQQGLGELEQSQPAPEELEPERRLYRRAVRMVELGADLDEIIQECELPRAEAELIFNLHRQKQT